MARSLYDLSRREHTLSQQRRRDVYGCDKKAGVRDGRWSTGAAFADYDGDGFVDLMVANYLDFKLSDLPGFGTRRPASIAGSTYSVVRVECLARVIRYSITTAMELSPT